MLNQELRTRIEEEEKILLFFVRYEKDVIEMSSKQEWETGVDKCLDILFPLYKLLKK